MAIWSRPEFYVTNWTRFITINHHILWTVFNDLLNSNRSNYNDTISVPCQYSFSPLPTYLVVKWTTDKCLLLQAHARAPVGCHARVCLMVISQNDCVRGSVEEIQISLWKSLHDQKLINLEVDAWRSQYHYKISEDICSLRVHNTISDTTTLLVPKIIQYFVPG